MSNDFGSHANERPTSVGIGLIGYGFMGRAHSYAYNRLSIVDPTAGFSPRLSAIAGRTEAKVAAAAERFGFAEYYTDWNDLLADERVQAVDNSTQPYLHAAPSVAALERGKHILCEKPLAPALAEARQMRDAAASRPELVAMCGFNYRFVPAVVLARQLVDEGEIGRVYHFRAQYLQEGRHDPRRTAHVGPEALARGALGSLGCHIFDMARFMVGEISSVQGASQIFIRHRPHPTLAGATATVVDDDAFQCVVEFENGASGTIDASFVASGRKNFFTWEINGEKGSIRFSLERLNELEVHLPGRSHPSAPGVASVMVTEPGHPFNDLWWPRGHVLGWEHTFVHELRHFLHCIVEKRSAGPEGATFEDGYRAALVSEAVRLSAEGGSRVSISDLDRQPA